MVYRKIHNSQYRIVVQYRYVGTYSEKIFVNNIPLQGNIFYGLIQIKYIINILVLINNMVFLVMPRTIIL